METSLSGSSPGFDVNDSGFQGAYDLWGTTAKVTWRQLNPDSVSRIRSVWVQRRNSWLFQNEPYDKQTRIGGDITFHNYWTLSASTYRTEASWNDYLTRGGPLTLAPPDAGMNLTFNSDQRKKLTISMSSFYSHNNVGAWNSGQQLSIGLKPTSSVTIRLEPGFNRSRTFAQYVRTVNDDTATRTFNQRYVFADLDQSAASLTGRLNMGITPKMSLQVYSQLLFSAGDYWRFKELERARTLSFFAYGQNTGTISQNGHEYFVDPDGPGLAPAFTITDPDFNFKSLRVNAVFRWEWKPGSTFFFVWTQNRADSQFPGAISPARDFNALFHTPADNVFLIKTTYWFNR